MAIETGRRAALHLGLGAAALGLAATSATAAADAAPLTVPEAVHLRALMEQLARTPRRRSFKSVPMILNDPSQWDHEALSAVLAYKPVPKQAWDIADINVWLDFIRNSLNVQVWGFRHPDFLAVSATRGSALLGLYDQAAWTKYELSKHAGAQFPTNTLIAEGPATDLKNYEDPNGAFSHAGSTIPTLMRRGVVFMACHVAIWGLAGGLLRAGQNPDKLTHDELAADLTNHLIPGVVLIPGAVGTMPELQQAGFYYAR